MPRKPMKQRQVELYLDGLQDLTNNLQALTKELKEETDSVKSIKANQVIMDFQNMSKQEILALTANQREILIFKVLKALVWNNYEPQ